jgi:hypothetical protein
MKVDIPVVENEIERFDHGISILSPGAQPANVAFGQHLQDDTPVSDCLLFPAHEFLLRALNVLAKALYFVVKGATE